MADAMDSKSISRKGVGVQVPASAPHEPDELARALVPVLLHKLNNTTQYLTALQALIGSSPDPDARSRAVSQDVFGGLHETALEVDDLGWILGLVANAAGANVLLERRERARLGALVRLVADCLRRTGRDLDAPDRELPLVAARSAREAWEAPWLAARWLYAAGSSLPKGSKLEWELVARSPDRFVLVSHAPATTDTIDLAAQVKSRHPGFDPALGAHACELCFPPHAFAWSAHLHTSSERDA
jgi:hypothetical protein